MTEATTIESPTNKPRKSGFRDNYGMVWVATAALAVISLIVAPGSMTAGALNAMLPFAAVLAVTAVGQTLVIQQRGIDMSSMATISLGGILFASLTLNGTWIGFAIPMTLLLVGVIGAFNGFVVIRFGITPIVATLATNAITQGLVQFASRGSALSAPQSLRLFVSGREFLIPNVVWISIVIVLLMGFIMSRTAFSRRFVAAGTEPRSAYAAGIRANLHVIGAYAMSAGFSAVAGILLASYLGTAQTDAGLEYLMPSIAAVVVGGTALTGGRGNVIATAVAAVFLTQLAQMALSLGTETAVQLLIQSLAIVGAVAVQTLRGR